MDGKIITGASVGMCLFALRPMMETLKKSLKKDWISDIIDNKSTPNPGTLIAAQLKQFYYHIMEDTK